MTVSRAKCRNEAIVKALKGRENGQLSYEKINVCVCCAGDKCFSNQCMSPCDT